MENNQFYAMLSRMKYVNRWGTMRNTSNENICEHSLNVAFIAHALGIINNEEFNGNIDAQRLAVLGMYHDVTEIITGDLPTPVQTVLRHRIIPSELPGMRLPVRCCCVCCDKLLQQFSFC